MGCKYGTFYKIIILYVVFVFVSINHVHISYSRIYPQVRRSVGVYNSVSLVHNDCIWRVGMRLLVDGLINIRIYSRSRPLKHSRTVYQFVTKRRFSGIDKRRNDQQLRMVVL